MDPSQHPAALPLYPDPFVLPENGDIPTPTFPKSAGSPPASGSRHRLSRITPTRPFGGIGLINTPHPPFATLSPSPSTPAQQPFNPDDFFASPPPPPQQQHQQQQHQQQQHQQLHQQHQHNHHPVDLVQATDRYTPELKRRLFGPADPLQSAPATATRKRSTTPISLGLHTPIPQPNFTNPPSNATTEGTNSLTISPTFSTASALLPPIPHAAQQQPPSHPPAISVEKRVASHLPPLPGTPFTPFTPFTPTATVAVKKKCSCKSSKCLKLYCPCFANSGFCGQDCTCKNCLNAEATKKVRDAARDTVLSRDPRAFEPKVRNSPAAASGGDIHTKGCNCRKGCGKNYCVCRELRVDCGPRCTCSGPNGCLNGKADALEDHEFKCKADHILGAGKRLGSSEWRPGMLPMKTPRLKGTTPLAKQEQKRRKKENLNQVFQRLPQQSAGGEIANFLSPSFPTLSMGFSPDTEIRNSMDEIAKVMSGPDESATPFSLRTAGRMLTFRDASESGGIRLRLETPQEPRQMQDTLTTTIRAPSGRPDSSIASREREDKTARILFSGQCVQPGSTEEAGSTASGLGDHAEADGRQSHERLREETASSHFATNGSSQACGANEGDLQHSRTPERSGKVPDIESATSPATDGKDPNVNAWGGFRGGLFKKEEKFEVCRLPRILRVKMGSGKMLRKFDL